MRIGICDDERTSIERVKSFVRKIELNIVFVFFRVAKRFCSIAEIQIRLELICYFLILRCRELAELS